MFADHEIDQTLQHICAHKLFVNSPQNIRLLKYLVEQALAGNQIKEHTIGIEVFNIDYDTDKNDGNVRVYMYKLRKKLSEYYKTEGANEKVLFVIEKGQYNLSFAKAETITQIDNTVQESKIEIPTKHLKFALIVIALLVIIFAIYKSVKPVNEQYCWTPFLSENTKNLCIVADHFVIEKRNAPIYETMLLKDVHSENDLLEYSHEQHKENLFKADYTLLSKMAPFAVHQLSHLFTKNNSNFVLNLESEFKYDDVRENNIVFVGQFKTMKTSKSIFLSTSKVFKTYLDGFKYESKDTNIIYNTSYYDNKKVEYVMVSYMKLETGKHAMFFSSNNDIGVMATVRNFTNNDWLNSFYNNLPNTKCYYNALFKVSGIQRTDMNCELVELEILEP